MTSALIAVPAMVRGVARSRRRAARRDRRARPSTAALQRSRPRRLHLAKADRWLWAWLSAAWSEWRNWRDWLSALVFAQPTTVVRWHRGWLRHRWTRRSKRRPAGPSPDRVADPRPRSRDGHGKSLVGCTADSR